MMCGVDMVCAHGEREFQLNPNTPKKQLTHTHSHTNNTHYMAVSHGPRIWSSAHLQRELHIRVERIYTICIEFLVDDSNYAYTGCPISQENFK